VRLIVDASVLVAEGLRERGRKLLAHSSLDLAISTEAWSETEHELGRRVGVLARRGYLGTADPATVRDEALALVVSRVVIVARAFYESRLAEGQRRVPRDPRDAPTVALALALDCGIWTADHDFFGAGVPVWTTETLILHLAAEDNP
jgi:predicted nucleic acid-binding protein